MGEGRWRAGTMLYLFSFYKVNMVFNVQRNP